MQKISELIIVLGAANDSEGMLTKTAELRCKKAVEVYRQNEQAKILLTGGFGEFNQTALPHAKHLENYLISLGVSKKTILGLVESKHTVDDAVLSAKFLKPFLVKHIVVITSEFHKQRAQLIFEHFFDSKILSFIESKNGKSDNELISQKAHESSVIELIRQQGGIIVNNRLVTKK